MIILFSIIILGSYGYLITRKKYILYVIYPLITSVIYLSVLDDYFFGMMFAEILLLFAELAILRIIDRVKEYRKHTKEMLEFREEK